MQLNKLTAGLMLCAFLAAPVAAVASTFEQAVKEASAAIDKAAAAGYEWRDSRKILNSAVEAEKAGKHEKAMKMVEKARMQGVTALAQAAKEQKTGPAY